MSERKGVAVAVTAACFAVVAACLVAATAACLVAAVVAVHAAEEVVVSVCAAHSAADVHSLRASQQCCNSGSGRLDS